MDDTLEIELRSDHLYARVTGTYSLEKLTVCFRKILAACTEHGLTRVLFDARLLEGEVPIVDRYRFGEFVSGSRASVFKVAFLVREDQLLPDRFLESVARNRGLLAFATSDEDEALRWLQGATLDANHTGPV